MKTTFLTLLLVCQTALLFSQNFTVLGTDSAGDVNYRSPDITEVAIATDRVKDSVWVLLSLGREIGKGWGFQLLFDTNKVDNDAKYYQYNRTNNDSLSYEIKVGATQGGFMNPHSPVHTYITDTGLAFMSFDDVDYSIASDSLSIVFRFPLRHVGLDESFNLLVYGTSWEEVAYEVAPDVGYYSYGSSGGSGGNGGSGNPSNVNDNTEKLETDVNISPNPISEFTTIKSSTAITSVKLFSLTGEEVEMSKHYLIDNVLELSLRDVSPGLYIAKIRLSDGKEISRKLIKD